MKRLRIAFLCLLGLFFVATRVAAAGACTENQIDAGPDGCLNVNFSIATDDLSFKFVLSTPGVFYVDYGDGSIYKHVHTNTTPKEYSHMFDADGIKTIRFAGDAIEYDFAENGSATNILVKK